MFLRYVLRWGGIALSLSLLASCGSGRAVLPILPPSNNPIDVSVSGQTVTKVRAVGNELVALEERLNSIFEDGPHRTLAIVQAGTRTVQTLDPPTGWTFVDFAVHPSGDFSAILTTARQVRIMRFNSAGSVRSDLMFNDGAAASDPYFNYTPSLKDDTSLQPALMHDAARVVPIGESLGVVLRTGRNAIVAYRLDPNATGAYQISWRTLVEPGASILAVGITEGSFDTFGQLQNHIRIFVDVDSDSPATLAVGVVNANLQNFTFRAHQDFFQEPIAVSSGALLTRIATNDGRRLGSTVIDTQLRAELHGVRATANGFMLVGRVLTEVRPDGTGWDAFTALVDRDGRANAYHVVDVNQGDILFDAAQLADGQFLALGTTGYIQNPSGESISESTQPLLALLNSDGSLAQRLSYPAGLRQNQLTSIAPLDGHWIIGGMVNGPGTHSGDADHSLIVSDGFVRESDDLPR